ncbi:hypothetical protein C5167_011036 [Papaver somniferum]|uniref:NmrA-like domain-containing protein n=1 Tax=Papaver somniferum TaxID=3469 RepID=A0A4Y7K3E0_PAPSO|nr:hypothetical protein C5167_011036 [Papaver somniferum]
MASSRCTALPTQLTTPRRHLRKPSSSVSLSWRRNLAQDNFVQVSSSSSVTSSSSFSSQGKYSSVSLNLIVSCRQQNSSMSNTLIIYLSPFVEIRMFDEFQTHIIGNGSIKCTTERTIVTNLAPGTPVRPTSILVVGATGTLGRQVVRRALDEGYDVRCLVRPRPAPADFLRDWGATVVNADLSKPETIPATLVGIHTVIDCATGRPEEPIKTVDWEGKVALIQCAKAMGIQKYVFFSIHNCDKHPEVPLMEIKYCTEKFIQDAGLPYITIRLCGFMQGLIGQYAVPILEDKAVWGTDAPTRIAYMDTQDIARLTFIALRDEKINNKLLTFAGPRAWTTQEVITLCERLAGQDANVTTVPVSVLKFTRQLTRLFEWTSDVADRLGFSEVLTSDTVFSVPMNETYSLLGVDQKDIITLEKYLQDYFTNILKKLKDLKASSRQSDYYI